MSEEDITDTGLEKVIRQFDNKENLISTYDDVTVNKVPLINTKNDGDRIESVDDWNEDTIALNFEGKYFPSKIMSSEESDDSYLGPGSFQVKCSPKKKKLFEATIDKDWHFSTKLSRAQILTLLYSCHELIEDKSHQLHSTECMPRIKELFHNNPNWTEKCYLNYLNYQDIHDTMKETWRKFHKNEKIWTSRLKTGINRSHFWHTDKCIIVITCKEKLKWLNIKKTLTPYFILKQHILFFKNLDLGKLTFSRKTKERKTLKNM